MNRRDLLKAAIAIPFLPAVLPRMFAPAWAGQAVIAAGSRSRVRPGDPAWPSVARWDELKRDVGGRLLKLESPFAGCGMTPIGAGCSEALKHLKNPYYIGDQPALTQTSGWVDAWTSQPSAYAVAAESTADVVAAVNFARDHRLRLVVKGGGHSYQGTSDSADSLLIWTRHMNDASLHDAFVGQGCAGRQAPQPAVTVGAGAMWIDAYDAVTTRGGRYVQGGGCTTVGVAGLIQSGGFGSFSKNYGMAAAGLLEAEIVTADGKVRIANACTNPDLFWGIKGGGGSSLGVVTRLTLRTRELPEFFGGVFGAIKAASDDAYRALIAKAISFYQSDLFNPHWGEQMVFRTDNILRISMVFQGLSQPQVEKIWAPFLDWVHARKEYSFASPVQVLAIPARHFWDAEFFRQHAPGIMVADDRPGAPRDHVLWAGDQGQVGQFLHGYKSAWMPASLLHKDRQSALVDAVFASTRHWQMAFHFNKGLAGASAGEITAAKDTATNPAVLDAFALAIIAAEGPPAFPGMSGPGPDLASARDDAAGIGMAMKELMRVAPAAGSYVSESDYFERDWQTSFWGTNYPKLAAVKHKYDPAGLFFVHHGVGSEAWSADGFRRLQGR
ncbi:FAD-binding oxidoreductase [Rhodanobacter sp. C05]|uniref:FAD-dependent oxidoreductase n=1 Tax=Rhodanobacter sp. C05 TaxID=1945855 RepID=UPI0009864C22|nr:FAD-binding oxidoreductase [Rhodanobacter sp. C05]OOG37120.1 FAD-linked oxidoreductase [Rhodanobacter sp. C05]